MDALGAALSSLDQAQGQFGQSVNRLVQAGSVSGAGDTVDLSDAAVSLITAKDQLALDLKLMKTVEDMQKSSIDMLA